jgi:hypothetical protein
VNNEFDPGSTRVGKAEVKIPFGAQAQVAGGHAHSLLREIQCALAARRLRVGIEGRRHSLYAARGDFTSAIV